VSLFPEDFIGARAQARVDEDALVPAAVTGYPRGQRGRSKKKETASESTNK